MLIDADAYLRKNIPAKPPVGDCMGWLSHNKRCCDCYEAERSALRNREDYSRYGAIVVFALFSAVAMVALLIA
jgi:hypothetical protein